MQAYLKGFDVGVISQIRITEHIFFRLTIFRNVIAQLARRTSLVRLNKISTWQCFGSIAFLPASAGKSRLDRDAASLLVTH